MTGENRVIELEIKKQSCSKKQIQVSQNNKFAYCNLNVNDSLFY